MHAGRIRVERRADGYSRRVRPAPPGAPARRRERTRHPTPGARPRARREVPPGSPRAVVSRRSTRLVGWCLGGWRMPRGSGPPAARAREDSARGRVQRARGLERRHLATARSTAAATARARDRPPPAPGHGRGPRDARRTRRITGPGTNACRTDGRRGEGVERPSNDDGPGLGGDSREQRGPRRASCPRTTAGTERPLTWPVATDRAHLDTRGLAPHHRPGMVGPEASPAPGPPGSSARPRSPPGCSFRSSWERHGTGRFARPSPLRPSTSPPAPTRSVQLRHERPDPHHQSPREREKWGHAPTERVLEAAARATLGLRGATPALTGAQTPRPAPGGARTGGTGPTPENAAQRCGGSDTRSTSAPSPRRFSTNLG